MSESINDTSFRGVVRRHLHSHSIADCKPNEPLAHLSGNMRENEMIVRERDAKHGPGQDHHDGALQFDRLFRIHNIRPGSSSRIAVWKAAKPAPVCTSADN